MPTLRSLIDGGVEQQGWLEKISNTNNWGMGIQGGCKKLKILNKILDKLLFPFYFLTMKLQNICLYSRSKIKSKVTIKQNLEHFKMINQRLFIPKFCNNSKMLLPSSWAVFIRALVFSISTRDNLSSFEYFCFSFLLIFRFILIQYTRVKTEKQLYYHKD